MRKLTPWLLLALLATYVGCMGPGKWYPGEDSVAPPGEWLEAQMKGPAAVSSAGEARTPEIPGREKFRFCCAFGTGLRVRLGQMPIPWLTIGRVMDAEDLGPHRYDGATAAIDDERENAFPWGEANGLIYTCRAGFLDTAHIREQVDWVAFFASQIDRNLTTGTRVDLTPEGAERRLILEPIPPELIEEYGRDEVIIALAQWLAYQGSVWHEIAQWYGWSLVNLYPEYLSGFSPEDPISNAIGINLLSGASIEQVLASEKIYNHHVDQLIQIALEKLEPVPSEVGEQAVQAVDQVWWDSQSRLPDNALVRRRYLDTDTKLEAWLLPEKFAPPALSADLEKECGQSPQPVVFRIPEALGEYRFDQLATLQITPHGFPAEQAIFQRLGPTVTQADFPELMQDVRRQTLDELGPRAHLPD
ncbi:MAG: DUF4056 domain-containing protein [Myxococcota bacterium]|nr:DUF4056 domain-containing protein [Myxococcota bacterium]